jgi:selenocysteine-specific translation elongation factor
VDKDKYIWKQRNEILHKKVNRQMTEIKDLHKKSETIFDLARKYPTKTYVELEAYRDADRNEEAHSIPLTESQKKQEELEPIPLTDAQKNLVSEVEAAIKMEKGTCITAEMRKDRTPLDKMKRRAEEAEGELSILKGIETNRVKEAQKRSDQLQEEVDRTKKENNDLFIRIAEATEVEESHRKMNGKLQERLTEVEEDNKKLSNQIEDKINRMRKSGM